MGTQNDRSVYQQKDGTWANKLNSASTPTSTHSTQQQAYDAAKRDVENAGGGEITVWGIDGKIQYKNTIGKKDPFPPRG
jgi:hypothetical protein